MLTDDLGQPVPLAQPPQRIVSLVPSLTEALARTCPDRLVGATDWCTHPTDLDVPRVRGTKNPDRGAILDLRPDLVVTNQEENRRIDVERLRAGGVPVWVTVIESLDSAFRSMRRLLADALAVGEPDWLSTAVREWSSPEPSSGVRVVVPIWRDPWIVVGARTFAGDVLAKLGLVNVFEASDQRYPRVELEELQTSEIDLVLLPDEPYVFTADDGPEAFPCHRTVGISGRQLTWYGPSLATARGALLHRIHGAAPTPAG